MTYQQRKALRLLDHAIDHVCPKSKPCFLMVIDGKMKLLPHSPEESAREILAQAMCEVIK